LAKINFEEVGSSGSVVTVTISNKTCPTLKLGLILLEFDLFVEPSCSESERLRLCQKAELNPE